MITGTFHYPKQAFYTNAPLMSQWVAMQLRYLSELSRSRTI